MVIIAVSGFTLEWIEIIWAVRNILINDYGMSEAKANVAILIAVDAEKQISPIEKYKIGIESYKE